MLFLCVLALPDTEAPHLGVSSGGVEVEGVFAKFAGNGSLSSGRQLGRGGSGRYFAAQSAPCPPYNVILGVANISGKKLLSGGCPPARLGSAHAWNRLD